MNCRKLLLLLALLFPCSVLAQTGIAYSDIALTPTAGNNSTSRVMSAQIGLYCCRETTQDIRSSTDTRQESPTAYDLNQYAVFDNIRRQRGLYQSKAAAEAIAAGKAGWTVQPVMICNANTLHSVIHDERGAEYELRHKHGMRQSEILPDIVWSYKKAMQGQERSESQDFSDDW